MFVKGKSGNPTGQSAEALAAIRKIRHLLGASLKNLTVADIEAIYRDKNGNIVKYGLLEYLKLVLHYWPDGFVDPDAKPADKAITIRVEVVAPPGKPGGRKGDPAAGLVMSTIKVDG
jgi:hypothetical protein